MFGDLGIIHMKIQNNSEDFVIQISFAKSNTIVKENNNNKKDNNGATILVNNCSSTLGNKQNSDSCPTSSWQTNTWGVNSFRFWGHIG